MQLSNSILQLFKIQTNMSFFQKKKKKKKKINMGTYFIQNDSLIGK